MPYDVLILGGGASGLMAGCLLAWEGFSVVLAEKEERIGRKLLSTGNGRCNLGNADLSEERFFGDKAFLPFLAGEERQRKAEETFRRLGLFLRSDSAGRLYPSTFQASSVVDAFRYGLKAAGCTVRTGFRAVRAEREENGWSVRSDRGERIRASVLLAAMGGCASPGTGGSLDGYTLLKELRHEMVPPVPALAPLVCDKNEIRGLKGVRLPAALSLEADGKPVRREEGEVLFADYGLSGILAMQLCYDVQICLARGEACTVKMDLFPDKEEAEIRSVLEENRVRYGGEEMPVLFAGLLPRVLAVHILKKAGIGAGGTVSALTGEETARLAALVKTLPFPVAGTQGFQMAQIAAGGADHTQVDPETLASRKQEDLYVAGELLNIHGDCGGYNLFLCWSSAMLAAQSIGRRLGKS